MAGPFYFAWAGETIAPQVTKGTTGNTHGGVLTTATATGDIESGSAQLKNLVINSSLTNGQLYEVTGPGLDAFFIYQGGATLDLSATAAATLISATFQIKKPIVIENTIGAFSGGGSSVILDDASALVIGGTYGLASTAIGYWTDDFGVAQLVSGTAFFQYGGGNAVQLQTIVEIANLPTTDPDTGLTVQTFNVETRAVSAFNTEQQACVITGFADAQATLLDNMPPGDLAALTAGLRYNITGPGLVAGTTFIAPGAGASSVTLDRAAEASGVARLFTVTGPRTPNAPFDPALDARDDEEILSIEISQSEGDFASLKIALKNPMVGLLAPGRRIWCWLSWDANWTPNGVAAPDIVPLFNGRLVGAAKRQAGEVVELEFLARPDDYQDQKTALATAMQVLPWWDPVWIATKNAFDPDTVLEAYSVLWHTDRVSLAVTTSDVISGEDGTVTIGEGQHFYEDFEQSYGQPPLNAVTIEGTVGWTQQGDGTVDLTGKICDAFRHAGSPDGLSGVTGSGGGGLISMLVGTGLASSWPKGGTSIGGGWSMSPGTDDSGQPLNYIIDAVRSSDGGWTQPVYYNVVYNGMGPAPSGGTGGTAAADPATAQLVAGGFGDFQLSYPVSVYKILFNCDWKANRKRTETVSAVLTADVQQVLSDPAAADSQTITLTSQFVGEAVDPGGGVPIVDLRRNSYFQTSRGTASWEHLLLLARARLRFRCRCVDVGFGVEWRTALGITLRNSVTLFDRRLPGGSATGKVKSYVLSASESGMFGTFKIACSIGRGVAVSSPEGIGVYAADGYMAPGYQAVSGGRAALITGEIDYEPLTAFTVVDDGIDLFNMTADTVVNSVNVVNGLKDQVDKLKPFQGAVFNTFGSPAQSVGRTLATKITLDLKPVAGSEFHTDFLPSVSVLALPKMIDLEAAG